MTAGNKGPWLMMAHKLKHMVVVFERVLRLWIQTSSIRGLSQKLPGNTCNDSNKSIKQGLCATSETYAWSSYVLQHGRKPC